MEALRVTPLMLPLLPFGVKVLFLPNMGVAHPEPGDRRARVTVEIGLPAQLGSFASLHGRTQKMLIGEAGKAWIMTARVIAVCNQKGGVGKTTIVAGLAELFSQKMGKRVLVIDADPQYNTTSGLGVPEGTPEFTLNDVLYGDESNNRKIVPGVAGDAVMPAGEDWLPREERNDDFPPIHLIAAERNLAAREQDTQMAREHRLRIALKGVAEHYDIVLIDCPPSLGLLTLNALTAATHALLVTEPRVASVEGLNEIVKTIAEVRENLNEDLDVAGVIINRVRKGRVDQESWIQKVRTDFGDAVLDPPLPEREVLARAQAAAQPLSGFGSAATAIRADLERLALQVWKGSGE